VLPSTVARTAEPDRTVYDVTALPPVEAGADQLMMADALPATAETPVGGSGTAAGTTAFDGADAAPVPTLLVALTVKVYDVPLVRPVIVTGDPETVTVAPLLATTVYDVIVLPPLETGAVQLTVAAAFPAVAVTPVGAPGTVAGTTRFDGADAALVPAALVAVTVNV